MSFAIGAVLRLHGNAEHSLYRRSRKRPAVSHWRPNTAGEGSSSDILYRKYVWLLARPTAFDTIHFRIRSPLVISCRRHGLATVGQRLLHLCSAPEADSRLETEPSSQF